jgi:hypothetical protein
MLQEDDGAGEVDHADEAACPWPSVAGEASIMAEHR